MKRVGKLWIRVFPDVPVSSKPAEVRQGKGKGSPEWWAARVKPGRVLFELEGVPQELAREAFTLAAAKRSEEHTSELQSLMRISYAVFCLKKKTNDNIDINNTT